MKSIDDICDVFIRQVIGVKKREAEKKNSNNTICT